MTDKREPKYYHLCLGCNIGRRKDTLKHAIKLLAQRAGEIEQQSAFIETEPWGYASQRRFINAVVTIISPLEPFEMLAVTQQIECELGRTPDHVGGGYTDRTIDIDILTCDRRVIYSPTLRLPHPRMSQRDFIASCYEDMYDTSQCRKPRVATIGYFDGIHLGHKHLLDQCLELAKAEGVRPLTLTFDRHPRTVVDPSTPFVPKLCDCATRKMGISNKQRADFMFLEFTPEMAALSAREFMRLVLRDQLNVGTLLIGYNHHFGHPGLKSETFEDYERYGREIGMRVLRATELTSPPGTSSSAIRRALATGDIATANAMLGRTYNLNTKVVHGHELGRRLGFPTANLQPIDPEMMVPGRGVYAAWINVIGNPTQRKGPYEEGMFMGMVNIGTRPTVDDSGNQTIEAHILDFSDDIYGVNVNVYFMRCIRKEQRFGSEEELKHQLTLDREAVRQVLTADSPANLSL